MRFRSSWCALGLVVVVLAGPGCSSPSGGSAAPGGSTGVPSFSGNALGPEAPPASAAPAASGSGESPPQSGGSPSGNAPGSAPEAPVAVPLAPAPAAPASGNGGGAGGQVPPAMDPPGMDPPAMDPPPVTDPPLAARLDNVLVFTRTTGFRHDSIEAGVQALQRLAQDNGFAVQRTESPADFNDQNLSRFEVVVWLNTDSEVMDEPARRAFERYIRAGGGYVGVHAASASEYNWAWYGQLIGGAAFFLGHPAVQQARVNVEIADHASTAHLPQSFTLTDEWYSFRANPRASVRVLLSLDESSYGVGDLAMRDHPIAWHHEFEGGRAWYTALGHPIALYSDARYTAHLLGGIRWAAGVVP